MNKRVLKLLLECSMCQWHNELILSPDKCGLTGLRNPVTGKVIISETMLVYIAPPQLRQMTNYNKVMRGCSIYNTSTYPQVSLNKWHFSGSSAYCRPDTGALHELTFFRGW